VKNLPDSITSRSHFQPSTIRQIIVFLTAGLLCSLGPAVFAPSVSAQNTDKTQFPYVAEITGTDVNVRAGPSRNFASLGQLRKGEEVVVVGHSYGWDEIRMPVNTLSFISERYVRVLIQDVGEVTADKVNIRAQADMKSAVIGQLGRGQLVRVIKLQGDFFQIEPPADARGWIATELTRFKSNNIPPERLVQLPSRNIYKKTPEPAPEKAPEPVRSPNFIACRGVVTQTADQPNPDVRHLLAIDGKPAYFLKGYRNMIDGFLQQKVKIEGDIQPDIKAAHPVILVTKIDLVL